ncbi:VOC family protein [Nocardia huaxiensis]|uniref:VOC family protein n=1 Tax=Nocardia huaxiensis TaxID=2755382 RepID=A0A7D6VMJ6_9NOCA|nr:VOC family protein [Nocardia huaxiensis]QLY33196.1 VOC family protein [Nocardia huaxiensis]UFS99877.1 VOC family protein [Nocardia huaxiensis]
MTAPAFNTVSWFQISSDKPEDAKKFYGELFGWNFAADPHSPGYDLINYPGSEIPSGGVNHADDATTNHAIFMVLVRDVAATVAETERLGGKAIQPPVTTPNGLVFAHLRDTSGNHFGVFTPAP